MSITLKDDLLGAAQAGDTEALNRIYTELSPRILGYLTARGTEDPEAVTQEVFLSVFSKLHTITGGEQGLRTFAFSVAHARHVDETRKRARQPAFFSYDPSTDARTTPSAETAVLDNLAFERALEYLAALGGDQSDVLTLRIVADLPLDEVARVLGKSTGSVKQLQRRGLLRLKKLLLEKDSSNHGA